MELRNLTPFPLQAWDTFSAERYAVGTLLVRSRHKFVQKGKIWHLVPTPEQGELFAADEFYGEAGQSATRYCSDYVPYKVGADILINACAYAPGGQPHSQWGAGVKIKEIDHQLAIFGQRQWTRNWGWSLSNPEPCTKVPVRYERAFGGGVFAKEQQPSSKDTGTPEYLAFDSRNPLGCGLLHKQHPDKHVIAPQIENPNNLIDMGEPYKQPSPMGLGAIGRSWSPRLSLAGTFDSHWLNTRHPYLPQDFNPLHYHDAHPGLRTPTPLVGGETMQLQHLCPEQAHATIQLPSLNLLWLLENTQGNKLYNRLTIDTVLLDIEDGLETGVAYLSWRTRWPIQANNYRLSVMLANAKRNGKV